MANSARENEPTETKRFAFYQMSNLNEINKQMKYFCEIKTLHL